MSFDATLDERLRATAFAHLRAVRLRTGGPIRRDEKFEFEGRHVRLMHTQQGIHKPPMLEAALSISTAHAPKPGQTPYDDVPGPDGYLRYKWRKDAGPRHYTTRGLREALREQLPLIWFHGIAPGLYEPVFPIWLVDEEPSEQQFVVALDIVQRHRWSSAEVIDLSERRYADSVTRARLHQPLFRARVLHAYESLCAVCRLRYYQLLDAAHIRPDAKGGEAIVPNGISLCKLHHSAYDNDLLGIAPDYRIRVRPDVLEESDGPTLRHSIQAVHDSTLTLPRRKAARPDRDLLAERFETFLRAS